MKYLSFIPILALLLAGSVAAPHGAQAADATIVAPQQKIISCVNLMHNLSYGSVDATTGGEVTKLQNFLFDRGYLSVPAVGVFGPLTRAAAIKFQSEHGLPATGFVGPMTRPVMRGMTTCSGQTGPLSIASVAPSAGSIGTTVTIHGTGFASTSQVLMGRGAIHPIDVNSDGTVLTVKIPESMGVYCTPGNACILLAMMVSPGTYDMSVKNVDGSTSNSVPFTVISSDNNSSGIVVNGLDAPARLTYGQTGTWTLHATLKDSKSNDALHYSVVWGDESSSGTQTIKAPDNTDTQLSSTFTHSYSRTGTYTPVFTVTDNDGNSASASAVVTIDPIY